ncbi:MAG: hypothetical protein OEM97_10615 [Acidimicrobiia bacterium]|nr:hypothetical protein [Acidimicrobiia bacterium]
MELSPGIVLAMWTGGIAGGAALVAWWRIVGPGFSWLAGSTVVIFGLAVAFFSETPSAYVGVALTLAAMIIARTHRISAAFFAASALVLLLTGWDEGGRTAADAIPLITGSVFLGSITAEMMLGHWYLVDPRLPRWALQRLDLVAGGGLLADFLYMVVEGALDWVPTDAVLGWAFVALALFTFLLVIAVWYSLQEPSYTGVMAATGLSYLAVLTSFGVVVLGRILT